MTWINKVNRCVAAGNLEMLEGSAIKGGGDWGEPGGSMAWGLSGRMGSMGLGWTGMFGVSLGWGEDSWDSVGLGHETMGPFPFSKSPQAAATFWL